MGEVLLTARWYGHLDDHDQEQEHVLGEVDLVDLEHRGAQTQDQSSDDDLDRLRRSHNTSRSSLRMDDRWNDLKPDQNI